jgi:hypothetical protein
MKFGVKGQITAVCPPADKILPLANLEYSAIKSP